MGRLVYTGTDPCKDWLYEWVIDPHSTLGNASGQSRHTPDSRATVIDIRGVPDEPMITYLQETSWVMPSARLDAA
jgi:hypothetical protein